MMSSTKSIIISNSHSNDNFICDSNSDSFSINDRNNSNQDQSVMQDSSADLQWCTELDYQYKSDDSSGYSRTAPKSIFEGSLLDSSNSYSTPPTSNYTHISNNFDANLAEIDIETFKSEDINAVFLQAGEDCASISKSIFEDSISLRSSDYTHEEQQESSFKEFEARVMNEKNCEKLDKKSGDHHKENTIANDISVDSLDMSFLENNTSELLMKCIEKDKKNYTIAFEGSIYASQEFIDAELQKRLNHSNKSQNDFLTNEVNNRKMVKSEYLSKSRNHCIVNDQNNYNVNHKSEQLILDIDRTIDKLSQSIPNMRSLMRRTKECRIPYCPVSGFIPLYDLQNSQSSTSHSSSSEFSPPRSLVKMFMQNRTSPLSSGQISPSLSYESHSQDSVSGNNSDSSSKPLYYNVLEVNKEVDNNNISFVNENGISKSSLNDEEVLLSYGDNNTRNRYRYESQKLPYSLKHTFPIKEVDETMTDSSNTDINMRSIDMNDMNTNLSDFNRNNIHSHQFIPKSIHGSNVSTQSTKQKQTNPFISSLPKTNPSNVNQSRTDSFDKKYAFDERTTNIRNNEILNQQNYDSKSYKQNTSTQFPVHIQDKEVQTSLPNDESHKFVSKQNSYDQNTNRIQMVSESPNEYKQPFYVYYPNYSLPDLSFLEQILDVHKEQTPQTVILSPTKHQLPNRGSIPVKMRQKNKSKCRPKSYTDYETLSKQSFSHIKDWDSLNILLPNEFKELIQKAQNASKPNIKTNTSSQIKTETNNKDYDYRSNNNVKMRPHKSNSQLNNNSSHINRANGRHKRFSLQEPYFGFSPQQSESYNSVNNTSCMSRSTTMPNCRNACHCHQHCHHNCCHSCCRTPCHSPSNTTNPFIQNSNVDINASSIDRLCQLLAMDLSFKKMMNIINGQNMSSNRSNCEPLPETKEEYLYNNNIVNKPSQHCSETDGSNFKNLIQRWESLATSPGSSTNTLSLGSNRKEPIVSMNKKEENNNSTKPMIAKKPQLILRRPQSYIPRPKTLNTDNCVVNRRKSLIPVPRFGQTKSPTIAGTKVKSNLVFK